jgi:hypothetical protein
MMDQTSSMGGNLLASPVKGYAQPMPGAQMDPNQTQYMQMMDQNGMPVGSANGGEAGMGGMQGFRMMPNQGMNEQQPTGVSSMPGQMGPSSSPDVQGQLMGQRQGMGQGMDPMQRQGMGQGMGLGQGVGEGGMANGQGQSNTFGGTQMGAGAPTDLRGQIGAAMGPPQGMGAPMGGPMGGPNDTVGGMGMGSGMGQRNTFGGMERPMGLGTTSPQQGFGLAGNPGSIASPTMDPNAGNLARSKGAWARGGPDQGMRSSVANSLRRGRGRVQPMTEGQGVI